MSSYLESQIFNELINNKAREHVLAEIKDEKDLLESYVEDLETYRQSRDKLEEKQKSILKRLEVIEDKIATKDSTEQSDGESEITT
jgi:hypothetical protein